MTTPASTGDVSFAYPGGELELFAHATNWKRYWAGHVSAYLGERVLEVGAGIGTNTVQMYRHGREWLCLEPDPVLAQKIAERTRQGGCSDGCRVIVGTVGDLPGDPQFDTILYLDVLEHIENDHAELAEAAERLLPGGHLVVMSPAWPWLFSPFDEAIGHHRRYTRSALTSLAPDGLRLVECKYLDSVGMLASTANRFVCRATTPSPSQIRLWDKAMVPASYLIDRLTAYRLGKTVLAVWKRG